MSLRELKTFLNLGGPAGSLGHPDGWPRVDDGFKYMTRIASSYRVIRSSGNLLQVSQTNLVGFDTLEPDFSKSVNSFDIGVFFSDTTLHKVSRNVFVVSGAILRPENKADEIGSGMSISEIFAKTSAADV